ncbi:hypothetical protein EJD97_001332, partial [Solanum chilense]
VSGEVVHNKLVKEGFDKLATMIPLFLTSTGFCGKRLDLYSNNIPEYQNKSQSEPLQIKHVTHVLQQEDSFNNDIFDVSDIDVDATYHRHRYATLLWNYAKSKNEEKTISDSEVTGTVASKYGRPRTQKEQVMDTTIIPLQHHG